MASVIVRPNGHKWIQFSDPNKRRKTIRLGKCSKRHAEKIKGIAEDLLSSLNSQNPLMPETAKWVGAATEDIYQKLANAGLLPEREKQKTPQLGDFLEKFIRNGKGVKKEGTLSNYRQAKGFLIEYFGHSFDMRELKKSDVVSFHDHLIRSGLSENTIARHIGRMKQFWNSARDAELVDWTRDPFAGQKTQVKANERRFEYVTNETITKVIESIVDREWKLILALCRYAGFRCPSEVLVLKWDDINWSESRIFVDSPKTGARWCPIFKEVHPYLRDCFEHASDGAEYVITRYRSKNSNLRTQLARWCKMAGVEMWGKPFQNLRSSCEIDLNKHFPMHVVAHWLGHSENVAFKHYLRTTDDDFQRAASFDFSTHKGEAKCEALSIEKGDLTNENEAKNEALSVDQILSESIKNDAKEGARVESARVLASQTQFAKHPEQDSNLRPTD